VARAAQQLDVVAQRGDVVGRERVELRVVEARDRLGVRHALLAGLEAHERVVAQVEHALEVAPMPSGQVTGAHWMPSTDSISSSSASGSRTSRSILLTNVMIGVSRSRHTSSSLIVCASTPFAASMTMTAASTAVSTR
jgi:hypothetical protein